MKRIASLVLLALCNACGSAPHAEAPEAPKNPAAPQKPASAPCTPPPEGTAPTYTALYEQYFAPNTPGHCATAHCHANPGFDVWLCGDDKEACYAGMVQIGLVNPEDPLASLIGNPRQSPLSWINTAGTMPFDATGPMPSGRDAILAWVAACAQND